MADLSTLSSYLQQTNELLQEVRAQLAGLSHAQKEAGEQSQKGFKDLGDALQSQSTAFELARILSLESELRAIQHLVEREKVLLKNTMSKSLQDVVDLSKELRRSQVDLVAERNKRVAHLLAPIYDLLQSDGARHIEGSYTTVSDHLDSFANTVSTAVGKREEVVRYLTMQTRAIIQDFAKQRHTADAAIDDLITQLRPNANAEYYTVPFYVIWYGGATGQSESFEILTPSVLEQSDRTLSGHDIVPITGFEDVAAEIRTTKLTETGGPGTGAKRRAFAAQSIMSSDAETGGIVKRIARAFLRRLLAKRKIALYE